MFGLFFSIAAFTATIASGILFYVVPQYMHEHVKGVATTIVSPTLSIISPTPTASPTVTPELSNEPSIQQQRVGKNNSSTEVITLTPTNTPTLIPTSKPTPTPTTKVLLDLTITLTPTILPISPSPTSTPNGSSSSIRGLNADTIFSLINDYRNKNGLSLFQKDSTTCTIAQQRAPQVYNEIFVTGTMDAGLKAMNLPYWITENIINNVTEQDAVDWWLNDNTHRQVIQGNYKYSCVACSGYSCVQIFTSYITK